LSCRFSAPNVFYQRQQPKLFQNGKYQNKKTGKIIKFKYLLHFTILCHTCLFFESFAQLKISRLFDSLIVSLTLYGNEVWGAAHKGKYLDRVEKFLKRACRYGYTSKNYVLFDIIRERDRKLWNVISEGTTHSLHALLLPK
jgi:hypothetical protein